MRELGIERLSAIIVCILLLFNSCTEQATYEGLTGRIFGSVSLMDGYSWQSDCSGAEILFEGNNSVRKIISDEEGKFSIDDLESGSYNIIYSKEGYTEHKRVGFQFVGGNIAYPLGGVALYKLRNMKIDSFRLEKPEYLSITVRLNVTATISYQDEPGWADFIFYMSDSPDVSYRNYVSSFRLSGVSTEMKFPKTIDTLQFPVGSDFYMICYPAWPHYQGYTDINTGCYIITSVSPNCPSDVASIVIPGLD